MWTRVKIDYWLPLPKAFAKFTVFYCAIFTEDVHLCTPKTSNFILDSFRRLGIYTDSLIKFSCVAPTLVVNRRFAIAVEASGSVKLSSHILECLENTEVNSLGLWVSQADQHEWMVNLLFAWTFRERPSKVVLSNLQGTAKRFVRKSCRSVIVERTCMSCWTDSFQRKTPFVRSCNNFLSLKTALLRLLLITLSHLNKLFEFRCICVIVASSSIELDHLFLQYKFKVGYFHANDENRWTYFICFEKCSESTRDALYSSFAIGLAT